MLSDLHFGNFKKIGCPEFRMNLNLIVDLEVVSSVVMDSKYGSWDKDFYERAEKVKEL